MRKTTYFFALLALCSTFALTSCSDDEPVPSTDIFEQNNANNSGESQGEGPLTEASQAALVNSQTINVKLTADGTFVGGGLIYKVTSADTVTAYITDEVDKETFDGTFIVPAYIVCDEATYTVTSLGNELFSGFSKMVGVSLPKTLIKINENAFRGCSSLTSVMIPNSVTEIGASAFYNCTSLKSVEIPNSVTNIRYQAFYKCSNLTSVVIGNSVTVISPQAFYGCNYLKEITSLNTTPPSTSENTFSGVPSSCELKVPTESVELYKKKNYWYQFKNIVGI